MSMKPFRNLPALLLTAILLLSACSRPVEATPDPSPQPLRVAMTASLRPLEEALQRCAQAHPEIALLVDEVPAQSLFTAGADLGLRFGDPGQGLRYAAPLAQEQIDVIVNPANPVRSLSDEEVRGLFTGRIRSWSEAGGQDEQVEPWVYPQGDDVRQVFEAALPGDEIISLEAMLAPDPASMLRAVADHPGAIGYLPHAWLDSTVRGVELDRDTGRALKQPILALANGEPQGASRAFLACLQQGEGKNAIAEHYEP